MNEAGIMKLRFDVYYFCELKKKSATMEKIRRYCSVIECPHLLARKKKNSHSKKNKHRKKETAFSRQ